MSSFLKRVPASGLLNLFPKQNWRIVLMCLLGATTFWFFNSLNKNYTTRLNYPIQFDFDRDGLVVVGNLPEHIEVDVSGIGWNLLRRSVGFNEDPLIIPLEKPTQTKVMTGVSLRPLIAQELKELVLNYVVSDSLFFNIDKKGSKKVALLLDSANISLDVNYRITSDITLDPDSILISGPLSVIDSIDDVLVFSVTTKEINEVFEEDVEIPNPSRYTVLSPNEAVVVFAVSEFVSQTMAVPYNNSHHLQDSTLDIKFMVDRKLLEQLSDSLFVAELNFEHSAQGDSIARPVLKTYPSYITDIVIDSSEIYLPLN